MTLAAKDLFYRVAGRDLLEGVDLTFCRGHVTALVGPNGAGKSTLLSCLAGLRQPSGGSAQIDGRPVGSIAAEERARLLAVLPQGSEIHWNVFVRSLVALGRSPWRGAKGNASADAEEVEEAMRRTDVVHLADRQALTLSGGERSRTLLARALAVKALWLLADEPLTGLDPLHQLTALAALKGAASGGTGVLIVIHDLTLAARFADRIVVLHDGRVAADGVPADVLTPSLLRNVYGIEAFIGRSSDGGLLVQPLRSAARA